MNSRLGNYTISFFMLILSLYLFFSTLANGRSGLEMAFIPFSLFIMFFTLGYLYPQFKQNDERHKLIQQKAMFYNYFILMEYLLIFLILLANNIINLSAQSVISILGALIIVTVNILFIIFSKIY
ncbi:permease [Bacillus haynesii]|nr:permease [Bacillus haynesii]